MVGFRERWRVRGVSTLHSLGREELSEEGHSKEEARLLRSPPCECTPHESRLDQG